MRRKGGRAQMAFVSLFVFVFVFVFVIVTKYRVGKLGR